MTTLFMVMIVLLVLATLTGLSWRSHAAWQRAHRAQGLLWCMHLLRLVMNLQQHRGMANAVLSGDTSFRQKLLDKRGEIDRQLRRLATLPGEFERRSEDFERGDISHLEQHWQELASRLPTLSAFESMTRHTALIATLLAWLRAVGESCLREPAANTGLQVEGVVVNFVEKLPLLAETLGQARALGSGLLAAGQGTAVGRVQMGYLAQRIDTLLQDVAAGLATPGVAPTLARRFENVEQCIHQLQAGINSSLLQSDPGTRLTPADYFQLATAAINSVFELIGQLQEQLEAHA